MLTVNLRIMPPACVQEKKSNRDLALWTRQFILHDRTVRIWICSDFDGQRRSHRINIPFSHAVKVLLHPIKPELFIHRSDCQCIERYDLKRDVDACLSTCGPRFPTAHHLDAEIVGFGVSSNGSYLMSCSNQSDLVIWSPGDQRVLAKLDTCLGNNYSAKVSFCGRFVAACGFSPDVKVWMVHFKAGKYVDTKIAFNLSGHNSGIYDIAFDQTSSRMATVSKDGSWKLYNTGIDFSHGELPVCLLTAPYTNSPSSPPPQIAMSGNGEVVAITNGCSVQLYSTVTGTLDATLDSVVPTEIVGIEFSPCGRYLAVAGDKVIRVMHNVTGYRVAIVLGRQKLAETTNSTARDRIQKLIAENEQLVAKFGG